MKSIIDHICPQLLMYLGPEAAYKPLMSVRIVCCSSSYWACVTAPLSSSACHFWSWSSISVRSIILRLGETLDIGFAALP